MFEAVKVVSPSSSHSLALQLSTENNKDFSHFSQPHAVETEKGKKEWTNHHHQQKLYSTVSIDPAAPAVASFAELLHFLFHIFWQSKKKRKFGNLFENDNF